MIRKVKVSVLSVRGTWRNCQPLTRPENGRRQAGNGGDDDRSGFQSKGFSPYLTGAATGKKPARLAQYACH